MRINNILLRTLLVLVAMAAMPTAMAANTFYLAPQDSTGISGSSTTVDMMLDADTDFAGYQVNINFDNSIVDISGASYVLWGSSTIYNGGTYITVGNMGASTGAGTYTLATLTLEGQAALGVSDLTFSNTMLSDPGSEALTHTATDGTYTNYVPVVTEPDIVVTNIDPYQNIFVDATNVFTVHVKNQGTADVTGSFDVAWEITDGSTTLASGTETITGLNIDEEKTFDFEWEPTVLQDTTVSAMADSGSAVSESDEDNDLSVTYVSGTSILPLSAWGYGGDEPLTNYETGEVVGDLIYTFGDSAYLSSGSWSTYTVNFNIGSDTNQISKAVEGIGSGTVKEARLYMYYNSYKSTLGTLPSDPEEKLTMTFDGNSISTDAKYEDSPGFGAYDNKYGTFAYDVTQYVTGDDAYQAVLTNDGGTDGPAIYSMALLVIYEDGSKNKKEYHIAEGYDLLTQYYYSSSAKRYSYHVVPEDATSTFYMPEATGGNPTLFTVAQATGSTPEKHSRLYFNTNYWSDPWTTIFGSTGTDIEDVSVLNADPNTVAFQDRGDGYSATNAILISELGYEIDLGGNQNTEIGRHIMVPITANDLEQFYGTVEMNLEYDTGYFDFVAVHSSPDSIVTAYDPEDDGVLEMSAWNQDGVKGDVVLATVELYVDSGAGESPELTLSVGLLQDIYGNDIHAYAVPATINIMDPDTDLKVEATSTPVSQLGKDNAGILNSNGRLRHTGDNETVISATVTDSGLGIKSVTVDLSAIGGSSKTPMSFNSGKYEVTATATAGISLVPHTFVVTATDNGGNTATDTTNELTVYRRGDVTKNNVVDMGDALYIARYTVGIEPEGFNLNRFKFVGDVQPADGYDEHITNMGDALYIARYTVGLEPAP
ncbi:MAG: DUF3344 domain-containing protein [Methanosarcinaceae archaeon]|nr:DUF3344 domain-containing protein [Methanosarcinaceae archaeon]